jgi:nicotinamide-nucleotide amidase
LTREAVAAAAGRPLVLDPAALEHIEALFARRQRPMPERNRVQAMFPASSRVIPNPEGTAPGIDLSVARDGRSPSRIFALPGVPAEMKRMWLETVAPAIRAMFPAPRAICYRRIKCFGVGESDLEQMLPDLIRRGREPQVGITVSGATITLRIAATGESPEACGAAMKPTVATIYECLGDLIFGEEDDELEDAVVRLLAARGKTLATAEWGTGGLIAEWLSEAALPRPVREGSEQAARSPFLGGFVVSSPAARRELLDSAGQALPSDASVEVIVGALATAARSRLTSDYALAIGELPIYDPAAATPPHFHYAVATVVGLRARSSPYAGPADILKLRAAKQALNLLRLELLHAK